MRDPAQGPSPDVLTLGAIKPTGEFLGIPVNEAIWPGLVREVPGTE
ncbi:hypothetical protein ACWD4G_26290 [Streptomyces sp. NPDC002643]